MNKEPIEMIEDMYKMMLDLKNQVSIMDNNIKLLHAKVNAEVFSGLGKQFSAQQSSAERTVEKPQVLETQAQPMPAIAEIKSPQISVPSEIGPAYKLTVVQGKVLSEDGKPMAGVSIKILNSEKKVIKETSTNRAGSWVTHLRPGKYISKVIVENKPTQFKLFEVSEGQIQLDV